MINWLRGNPCGDRWLDGLVFALNCAVVVTGILAVTIWAMVAVRALVG